MKSWEDEVEEFYIFTAEGGEEDAFPWEQGPRLPPWETEQRGPQRPRLLRTLYRDAFRSQ